MAGRLRQHAASARPRPLGARRRHTRCRDPARAAGPPAGGRVAMTLALEVHRGARTAVRRTVVVGLTAFLTVVDLFATQAILPSLTVAYRVTPAAMGLAVNACTVGMAVASLAVAL